MKFTFCRYLLLLLPLCSFAQQSQQWKYGDGFSKSPFYEKPGSITLHFSNHMFSGRKVATPPLNFSPQVTAARNFTLGPVITYFQFKNASFEAVNATRWVNPDIRYHELMAGLRAEYHFTGLMEKIINRKIPHYILDLYAGGWGGYSFVFVSHADADKNLENANERARMGMVLGARSLVLKWMGFSIEGGYSSYGYCSFGLFFFVR